MTAPAPPAGAPAAAPASASRAAPRMGAIDVVRGTLMVAITWSHALVVLAPGHHDFLELMRHVLSGTVGFTTISGLLVGWFAVVKRDRFAGVARRYRVQAARLVLVAHPLMALALFLPAHDDLADFGLRTLFITDALAILFLVLVPLVPRIPPRARLVVGLALVAANPLIDLLHALGPVTRVLRELLCGVDPGRPHVLLSGYGLLPLGGMFLVGSWLGALLADAQRAGAEARFAARLARGAAALAAAGAALVGVWLLAHRAGHPVAARLLYPDYETTLYPIYLGWTLLLIAQAIHVHPTNPVARAAALLGKTSLFVYVVQYYVVETIPELLGWKGALAPPAWAALCVAALAVMLAAGAAWNRWVKHA